jgi:DNA-binding response OmpR family regulator
MPEQHILVVDDDAAMRDLIGAFLSERGFRVSPAATGDEMANVLARDRVDLIVLDIRLGEDDGFALLRALPAETRPPAIVVTGHAREEADAVLGLELGADDYMTKPFGLSELLARVRAVLRREALAARRARATERRRRYRFAGWELNMRRRSLTSPEGAATPLTAGEFNLLAAFVRAPQRVLTREQLLAASRVHDEEVFDRSIDVQILRLRRKLEAEPSDPRLIRTERGVGYRLAASVELL